MVSRQERPGVRKRFRQSIHYLAGQGSTALPAVSLPAGEPYGTIRIDEDCCTFCMACAQICPTGAIGSGSDEPELVFTESACIQCGLCTGVCPEEAVALEPRLVFDRAETESLRTLYQEQALRCSGCGRPFAPKRLVERMESRLSGHWMYQSQSGKQRLRMCSRCRLQDLADQLAGKEVG